MKGDMLSCVRVHKKTPRTVLQEFRKEKNRKIFGQESIRGGVRARSVRAYYGMLTALRLKKKKTALGIGALAEEGGNCKGEGKKQGKKEKHAFDGERGSMAKRS